MTATIKNPEAALAITPEKQIYDLKQLLEISKSLTSTLDYPRLIDSILYVCLAQMKVTKACLYARKSLDCDTFNLHRSHKGVDLDRAYEYQISAAHPLVAFFDANPECFTGEELRKAFPDAEGLEGLYALEPALVVPLKTQGEVSGIIVLGDRIDDTPFTEYERGYAMNIAAMASIAIHNAFLFEMTTTDLMTKLRMKYYFEKMLSERMQLSVCDGTPLSVVMMDVDNFKKYNDTHGHTNGDAALKAVAKVISDTVRGEDVAARFGGEEFVLLLWDTDLNGAARVAERIRSGVETGSASLSGVGAGVTISCGAAQYDAGLDWSWQSLVDRADKALYHSKQDGRNRVSTGT